MPRTFPLPEIKAGAHLPMSQLEARLASLDLPRDHGRVVAMMARPSPWQRRELQSAELSIEGGMPGDRWKETPLPQMQLATMSAAVAEVIANGQPLALFGDNLFLETTASGLATIGTPGAPGFGKIQQGALETSNVNVVAEITNLITAQRAYEMNSRVIQASDEMLSSVVQLR